MKEIHKIVALYNQVDFSKRKAALATVVATEGSSYRRQGAKMLITDDGRFEGSISGGCLEGDALRKARQVMASGVPMLITYDTMEDGAGTLGIGLGCNGIIHVFIEPLDHSSEVNPVLTLKEFLVTKQLFVVATVIHDSRTNGWKAGRRFQLADKACIDIPSWLEDEMSMVRSTGKAIIKSINTQEGNIDIFLERIDPGVELLICGAGHDAIPLASLSIELGWQVTITDDCIAHLSPKLFPPACQLIHASREEVVKRMNLTERTAVVLLSHNYKYDLAILEDMLQEVVPYIGILGPAKRFYKMKTALLEKNIPLSPEHEQRIFAPAGLDIGAETPEEIALSIISEIKAVFSKRSSGFLKNRLEPIHERNQDRYIPSSKIHEVI